MKSSVSSVDLRVLSREFSSLLVASRFDKAYSLSDEGLRLRFHVPNFGARNLVVWPNFACVSGFDFPQLEKPRNFVMVLRKHLEGKVVRSVEQHDFDRILEIGFDGLVLIIELFSKGNVILCSEDRKILGLLDRQKWKDRTLTFGREYAYPPAGENPVAMNAEKFKTFLRYSEKGLAAAIASIGLGGFYAEEICINSGFDKAKPASSLNEKEAGEIYESFRSLIDMAVGGKVSPAIILDENGKSIDVEPFDFKLYEKYEKKRFDSFNDAVDEFFSSMQSTKVSAQSGKDYSKALGKLELMKQKQEEALTRLEKEIVEHQRAGDLIYQNLSSIENILEQVRKARAKGLNDNDITEKFISGRRKGVAEAKFFKKLEKSKIVLEL